MLQKFACGHVGRSNYPPAWRKGSHEAFIRVAEIRGKPVENKTGNCPDCRRGS